MKILNTLQELWQYCQYCPICHESCREIVVSVGPDSDFECLSYEKTPDSLKLNCEFRSLLPHASTSVEYNIDCLSNEYQVFWGTDKIKLDEIEKICRSPYFYFYINSICRKCDLSYTNSLDVELNPFSKIIQSIGIDRDGVYLLDRSSGFHVTAMYSVESMAVSKIAMDSDRLVDDGRVLVCPLVNLDFANASKSIQKIKTLILFS